MRLREKPLISREKGNREVVTSETNYLYNRYKGLMPLKLGLCSQMGKLIAESSPNQGCIHILYLSLLSFQMPLTVIVQ